MTIHLPSGSRSVLDELLSGTGPLKASFATAGAPLHKGHIYIAPPNRHLMIERDQVQLGAGARENNSRPAIDVMLRSAAVCCGNRSVGMVLTGTLSDGAAGLRELGQCGGITVVQDPSSAAFAEMPQNALERLQPDHLVKLEQMPALLEFLVQQPAGDPHPVPAKLRAELDIARQQPEQHQRYGPARPPVVPVLPGLRRRDVGAGRRRFDPLSLSRRPCL
jgi:two-component system chemotaxis response regulator CheB